MEVWRFFAGGGGFFSSATGRGGSFGDDGGCSGGPDCSGAASSGSVGGASASGGPSVSMVGCWSGGVLEWRSSDSLCGFSSRRDFTSLNGVVGSAAWLPVEDVCPFASSSVCVSAEPLSGGCSEQAQAAEFLDPHVDPLDLFGESVEAGRHPLPGCGVGRERSHVVVEALEGIGQGPEGFDSGADFLPLPGGPGIGALESFGQLRLHQFGETFGYEPQRAVFRPVLPQLGENALGAFECALQIHRRLGGPRTLDIENGELVEEKGKEGQQPAREQAEGNHKDRAHRKWLRTEEDKGGGQSRQKDVSHHERGLRGAAESDGRFTHSLDFGAHAGALFVRRQLEFGNGCNPPTPSLLRACILRRKRSYVPVVRLIRITQW